ncbi:MAG: RDD family protein [Bacteroidales bacterium]|nr:RDD family protein [Bacteroidales bacterium]
MKEKKVDFYKEKDVLGQEKPIVFGKSDVNTHEEKQIRSKIDHSAKFELPSIKTRYFSMLIDVIVILVVSLGISTLFEKIGTVPDYIRGLTFLIVVILYEPILVSTWCTIGQLVTNIRVRKFQSPDHRIWFFSAIMRLFIKILLGWISFITITFNDNRRAIHDFVAGSIVIVPK